MKYLFILFLVIFCSGSYAQDIDKLTKPIIEEGKKLYLSEMASWYGTDLFLSKYPERENIGGYFSYTDKKENICVFFSKQENPKIIGTIKFDDSFDLSSAIVNMEERKLTKGEKEIYDVRQKALRLIQQDTMFKAYENMNFNIIPMIGKKENKVYVLTGPTQSGLIVFGNDYLITYDKKNNVKSKKALHKNIIPITFTENENKEMTFHTHLPETGDFITATDICTLMLYGKFTGWKQHNVASEKYLSMWYIDTDKLFVITMDAVRKINEQQKENAKSKNEQKEEK